MTTLFFSGHSGAGKTSLITAMVPLLLADGVKVGVIKHHHASLSSGKDSQRLFAAGVPAAVLAEDGILRMADAPDLADAIRALGEEVDLVLVEGLKHAVGPKIWVGEGWSPEIHGVVAWVGTKGHEGAFALSEVERLYREVVRPMVGKG